MSVSPPQPIELRALRLKGHADKLIYYMPLEQLNFWPESLSLPSRHFGVLLVCDGKVIPNSVVLTIAKAMTNQGLAYLCTWGPDCERIHDLFDEAIVDIECSEGSINTDSVIMTTWHDEPMEDAVWYFLYSTLGAGDYAKTCQSWIVVPIESADWVEKARGLALEL